MEFLYDDSGLLQSSDILTFVSKESTEGSHPQWQLNDGSTAASDRQEDSKTECDSISIEEPEDIVLPLHNAEEDSRLTLDRRILTTKSVERKPTPGGILPKCSSASSISSTSQNNDSESILVRKVEVKRCANGDVFSGYVDIVTGEPVQGRLTCARTGEVYEGPFSRGVRHGEGAVSTRVDGSKFLGSYRKGFPYCGTLITSTFTYQGQFLIPTSDSWSNSDTLRTIFHGSNGTLVHKSGALYEGDFSHGRFHGNGHERTASGLVYRGQYRAGKWHGNGELIFEQRPREELSGREKSKKQNPTMAAIREDDVSVLPVTSSPKFDPEVFRYTYSGSWEHGEREGSGFEKIVFAEATHSESSLEQKSRHSDASAASIFGTSKSSTIENRTATFSGEFHRDRRHGIGVLTLPDKTVTVGPWINGIPGTKPADDFDEDYNGSKSFVRRVESWSTHSASSAESRINGGRNNTHPRRARPSWKIEYPNGNCYQGECTFSIPTKNMSPEEFMKVHLHINTSTFPCLYPHGYGTMIYSASRSTKSAVYTGQFKIGKRHGHGRIVYEGSGEQHEFSWLDDLPGEVGGQSLKLYKPLSISKNAQPSEFANNLRNGFFAHDKVSTPGTYLTEKVNCAGENSAETMVESKNAEHEKIHESEEKSSMEPTDDSKTYSFAQSPTKKVQNGSRRMSAPSSSMHDTQSTSEVSRVADFDRGSILNVGRTVFLPKSIHLGTSQSTGTSSTEASSTAFQTSKDDDDTSINTIFQALSLLKVSNKRNSI